MDVDLAIKDWSVTVEALGTGSQIFLVRKHNLPVKPFLLQPTYTFYIQNPKLIHDRIKPAFVNLAFSSAEQALRNAQDNKQVTLQYLAEPDCCLPVNSANILKRIDDLFIWQLDHVIEYMQGGTIKLWLLRVQKLEQPVIIPVQGKKRSVLATRFQPAITIPQFEPVLPSQEYDRLKAQILSAIPTY